jgi:hypothetical protein
VPRAKDKGKAHKRKRTSKALIGRVKRAVKKSRRKMNDERFRKELQRTITFLEGINGKIAAPPKKSSKEPSKKTTDKSAGKAEPARGAKSAAAQTKTAAAPVTSGRVQAKKKK